VQVHRVGSDLEHEEDCENLKRKKRKMGIWLQERMVSNDSRYNFEELLTCRLVHIVLSKLLHFSSSEDTMAPTLATKLILHAEHFRLPRPHKPVTIIACQGTVPKVRPSYDLCKFGMTLTMAVHWHAELVFWELRLGLLDEQSPVDLDRFYSGTTGAVEPVLMKPGRVLLPHERVGLEQGINRPMRCCGLHARLRQRNGNVRVHRHR
jgi:hypothetical protein